MSVLQSPPKRPLTPLWVIALFLSLTETVLGIGVIRTTGGIQIALTAFVMFFPTLVAIGFFAILWSRPYVLYPPTEYGPQTDVTVYVDAIRGKVRDETAQALVEAGNIAEVTSIANIRGIPVEQIERDLAQRSQILHVTVEVTDPLEPEEKIEGPGRPMIFVRDFFSWIGGTVVSSDISSLSYGRSWVLVEKRSGTVLRDFGTRNNRPRNSSYKLNEIGLISGMEFFITSPEKVAHLPNWEV
jgi:hypothetical protein